MSMRCLATGRQEGDVRGLGRPACISAGIAGHAGVRDAIVAMKPGKLGGAKGVRKVDEVLR